MHQISKAWYCHILPGRVTRLRDKTTQVRFSRGGVFYTGKSKIEKANRTIIELYQWKA